jgi:D-alanyl-D-alanine dipeptidase
MLIKLYKMNGSRAMKKIEFSDLVHMDGHDGLYKVDVVYADKDHPENVFGCALYRKDAQIHLHKRLAAIVFGAAKRAKQAGYMLHIKDGLRTMEAQRAMGESPAALQHPEWLVEPRLISPPGAGGHPRGMAVDVTLFCPILMKDIDMGTAFDCFPEDKNSGLWPAHRDYTDLPALCLENRAVLDGCMIDSAVALGEKLLPLSAEWWDYRFYPEQTRHYAPLSDLDIPEFMRLCANKPCKSPV